MITLRDEGESRVLVVEDDGIGADLSAVRRGHGLENMEARARQAGGELRIRTRPGGGCAVTARVPA
jgi:signal transduction histidine kinase